MTETTREGVIAAEMANRNFDEMWEPVIDELKTTEAKRMYCKTLLMRLSAKMSHVASDTFFDDINEMIATINEQCGPK